MLVVSTDAAPDVFSEYNTLWPKVSEVRYPDPHATVSDSERT